MHRFIQHSRALFAFIALIGITACGGGGSEAVSPTASSADSATTQTASVSVVNQPPTLPVLQVSKIEVAQTHVIPPQGITWTTASRTYDLHLTANREALVLLDFTTSDMVNPAVKAWRGSTQLGQVSLLAPNLLGNTEDNGTKYSTSTYSASLPAAWLQPGVQIKAVASNYSDSITQSLNVGASITFPMRILPFYLFGADPSNSVPMADAAAPNSTVQTELLAKWPVTSLNIANHPGQKVQWPNISVPPLSGNAGYVPQYRTTQNRFDIMTAIYGILRGLRAANGESQLATQYYSPLMMLDVNGVYGTPGGGIGGGAVGTGDASYSGVFIHEAGHAFGLPHQGEAYTTGNYPYVGGSLAGSRWGYDAGRNEFLSPLIPPSALNFSVCKSTLPHQLDSAGNCIKQDPMQSGAGDQASSYAYGTFSDFSTAQIQANLEETGYVDAGFSTKHKLWNKTSKSWQALSNATQSSGLYGTDNNLPLTMNVPVHAVMIAFSNAGTAGVSQIYTPLSFSGNLLRNFDPTVTANRNAIKPDTGTYPWLCRNSGCDYTLRVTYADNSKYHSVITQGFRGWFTQDAAPPASATTATDANSFRLWAVNVPGTKALQKLELLSTPRVWTGMPSNPTVLLTRNF